MGSETKNMLKIDLLLVSSFVVRLSPLLTMIVGVDTFSSFATSVGRISSLPLNNCYVAPPPAQLKLAKNDRTDTDLGVNMNRNDTKVDELLALLSTVPSNVPTPKSLTDDILGFVRKLEEDCPTNDGLVLSRLSGNWELLWTAQDKSSSQYNNGGWSNNWINPLENQSYSNNPFGRNPLLQKDGGFANAGGGGSGRANPILPREIQDALERIEIGRAHV